MYSIDEANLKFPITESFCLVIIGCQKSWWRNLAHKSKICFDDFDTFVFCKIWFSCKTVLTCKNLLCFTMLGHCLVCKIFLIDKILCFCCWSIWRLFWQFFFCFYLYGSANIEGISAKTELISAKTESRSANTEIRRAMLFSGSAKTKSKSAKILILEFPSSLICCDRSAIRLLRSTKTYCWSAKIEG